MQSRDTRTDAVSTSWTDRSAELADAADVQLPRHRCVRSFGQDSAAAGRAFADREAGLRASYAAPALHAPLRHSRGREPLGTVRVGLLRSVEVEGHPTECASSADHDDSAGSSALPV